MPKHADRGFPNCSQWFPSPGIYQQCWVHHLLYKFSPATWNCFFKTQKGSTLKIILTWRICCFPQQTGERSLISCATLVLKESGAAWQREYCWSVCPTTPELPIPAARWGLKAGREHFWFSKVGYLFSDTGSCRDSCTHSPKSHEISPFIKLETFKKKSNTFSVTSLFGYREKWNYLLQGADQELVIHQNKLQQVLSWSSNPPYFRVFFKFFL